MTKQRSSSAMGEIPDALIEEAVIWQARLREPADSGTEAAARRGAFDDWLAADPRHPAALEEAERLWGVVMAPAPRPVPRRKPRPQSTPMAGRMALAACVALALWCGWAWHGMILDRLRSDHVTGVGERSTLALDDGSTLVLGPGTAVAIDLGAAERRVRLFHGQAWFEVRPDRDRPFTVATDAGSVRVTGTRFDVRVDGDAAVVSLSEGRVELRGAAEGARPVALAPGQQARLRPDGVSAPRAFDETAVGAWRRGQFVFYGAPLAEVVATLNQNRPGRILILRDDLKRLRVSGVFTSDDSDAVIAAIEETLPVRVQRLTDYLVLLH